MDPSKHSDLPYYLRIHGSVLPKMILPLLFVGGWATAVTLISKKVYSRKCWLGQSVVRCKLWL